MTSLFLDKLLNERHHLGIGSRIVDPPEIRILVPDFVAITQRPEHDALVTRLEHDGTLAARDHETRYTHHIFRGHRVPDDRERLLADRIVWRQIIRRVEPNPLDGISRGEDVDIDRFRAVQRDVFELFVFENDVVVLAALIALYLFVVVDFLAGDGIDIMAHDTIMGLAVERMEADLFAFRRRRHHLRTGQVTSDSFR